MDWDLDEPPLYLDLLCEDIRTLIDEYCAPPKAPPVKLLLPYAVNSIAWRRQIVHANKGRAVYWYDMSAIGMRTCLYCGYACPEYGWATNEKYFERPTMYRNLCLWCFEKRHTTGLRTLWQKADLKAMADRLRMSK
jgi:hypothetical protein